MTDEERARAIINAADAQQYIPGKIRRWIISGIVTALAAERERCRETCDPNRMTDEERAPFTRRDELTAREVLANVIECQDATKGGDDGEHVIAAALAAERERTKERIAERVDRVLGQAQGGHIYADAVLAAIRALGEEK